MGRLFQKRLILVILISLLVLNAAVLGGSRLILLDSYLQIERQAVEANLLRVANAVRNESEALGTLCADWSTWDDTYAFVENVSPDYISSNLVDMTLLDLSLNALLIFDAQGTLVFGKGMDLDEETPLSPSPQLLTYFKRRTDFWPPQKNISRQDGLLTFSGRPLLLSFRPILTSLGEGPARGIVVMARWFDAAVIEQLAEQTALKLSLQPLTGQRDEVGQVVSIQVAAVETESIHGEVLLHDIEGAPAFHLAIDMERKLFKQGQNTVAYFQLSFFLVSLGFGVLLYLLLIVARTRRAAAEKRFRQVFENATDGLFVVEKPDQLAFVNSAAKKILGGVVDQKQAEQVCFAHPELSDLITAGLAGKIAGPVDVSIAGPAESHLRAYMAPLLAEDGKHHGAIATLQDTTREKELERLKNEFIAAAAHELNTPLSIIIGYTDLLLSGEHTDAEELLEFYNLINEKSHALEKIVDDLLHLGKVESGREIFLAVAPYDFSASIRQIVDAFDKKTVQHHFKVNLPEDHLIVVADRHRLGQVFDNLLSNAIKYSPNGGVISVCAVKTEGELLISVADQGVGLTEEQVAQVFEKFYRVDNSSTAVRGLGLGLNITRNILEAHGGRIWLESVPGEGTRFYFTLPDDLNGRC